jgi:FkbM family methyltransferase
MLTRLTALLRRTPPGSAWDSVRRRIQGLTMPAADYRIERDHRAMLDIMEKVVEPASTCIDIGASEGRVLNEMLRLAPGGRHFAFEPIPQLAGKLRAGFPQVCVTACALSDTEETAIFHHAVDLEGWSGLRRQRYPVETRVEEIQVPVRRLDDILPPDAPVRFIKIDVEGAELHVLKGARETIRRCRPHIIFEYAEIHGLEYGTRPEDIYDYLTAECGLVVRSILGSRPRLRRDRFIRICRRATASNYGRSAEGNFWASPD